MGSLIGIDLLKLDRDVRRAADRMVSAERSLSHRDLDDAADPFFGLRNVSSRASFQELAELPDDPLVHALRAWVGALTIDRVTWEDTVRVEDTWREESHRSKLLGGLSSPADLFDALLREHEHPGRRHELASELALASGETFAAARLRAERRVEAKRLLGAPLESDHGLEGVPVAAVEKLARAVLHATELVAASSSPEVGWEGFVFDALGRGAVEGWPAALNSRWLSDRFYGSALVEGLRLDIAPLPEALGASSFCRALGLFGQALARADVPQSMPFTLARSPFDPIVVAREALFAALPAEPAFVRRAQGLGRVAARDQARRVALALGRSLRIEALRVLLHGVLLERPSRTTARGREESAFALGAPLEPTLIGLVPRLAPSDPARFLGVCSGIACRASLRERFDEDWFDNPRAHEALRTEHHEPKAARTPTAESLEPLERAVTRELAASWL